MARICKATSKRTHERCKANAVTGKDVCWHHGGASPGAPITHALYSRCLPSDWKAAYEYYKSDPEYTSSRPDIALAQTNLDRFLAMCEGVTFSAEMREHVMAHLEQIRKIRESENKRLYSERVVSELLAKQVAEESRILREVLSEHLDADTTERVIGEFADAMGASAAGISASIKL